MTKKMFFEHSLTMNEVLFYSAGKTEANFGVRCSILVSTVSATTLITFTIATTYLKQHNPKHNRY